MRPVVTDWDDDVVKEALLLTVPVLEGVELRVTLADCDSLAVDVRLLESDRLRDRD